MPSGITGLQAEIQPRQSLISLFGRHGGSPDMSENIDAVGPCLYKTPQWAAGAIPPPLFFERRRPVLSDWL
jgi:hypothetical protein